MAQFKQNKKMFFADPVLDTCVRAPSNDQIDHILGMGREISILDGLIQYINSRGILFWNQVIRE